MVLLQLNLSLCQEKNDKTRLKHAILNGTIFLRELLPRRKRDKCNVLLSPDIDKIIQEECKINSRMDQVRGRINGVWKLIIWILRW